MRVSLVRSLHTSRAVLAFKQSGDKSGGGAKFSTPRKSSGEYRWFEDAAPYSNFHKEAPQVSAADVNIVEATPQSLPDLQPGQLISWPSKTEAFLHHVGSYKPTQQNELFQSHVSVVRGESKKLWTDLLVSGRSSLLTGSSGVGKTTLLSQAHAAAKANGWGVIHISQVNKLLDGSSPAVYDEKTNLWNQPMFMSRLWKKTIKANRELLKEKNAPPSTLSDLVSRFNGHKVLVTADNVNALNHSVYSANTNQKNEKLYHNDLEVVNTLLSWLQKSPAEVCVMAATSGNYKTINWKGYDYAPLTDFDPELIAKLSKATRLHVGRFSGTETKAFAEYLNAAKVSSKSWKELYQFGNGNPRSILTFATNFAY